MARAGGAGGEGAAFLKAFNKEAGEQLATLASGGALDIPRGSTGVLSLDVALGVGASLDAGWPLGRWIEMWGVEGCLAGDTEMAVTLLGAGARGHKRMTLEQLYRRFNGVVGPGGYARKRSRDFYLASVNDAGRIVTNKVLAVIDSGFKPCFELTTQRGHKLVATADHPFMTGANYTKLSDLKVGDKVCVHENTPYRACGLTKQRRPEVIVKHHPLAPRCLVTEPTSGKVYEYRRLRRSRAVVEADMNGLTLDEYIARLNSGDLTGLTFLSRDIHVHHLDENASNDALSNLAPVLGADHNRQHALEHHNDLRFMVTEDAVTSIVDVGVKRTYDVKMAAPWHNFVAQRLVVHNCGKTTLALLTVAAWQRAGRQVAYIDAEHKLDKQWARKLGVDLKSLLIIQPSSGEKGFKALRTMLKLGGGLAVIDSIAGMQPQAVIDARAADEKEARGMHARLISDALNAIGSSGEVAATQSVVLCLNQVRTNPGQLFGNPDHPTGGNALKFWTVVRVSFLSPKPIVAVKSGRGVVGTTVRCKVVKNQTASPYAHAEWSLSPRGFNLGLDVVNTGILLGVLKRPTPKHKTVRWADGTPLTKLAGIEAAAAAVEADPDVAEAIRQAVLAAVVAKAAAGTSDEEPAEIEEVEVDGDEEPFEDEEAE